MAPAEVRLAHVTGARSGQVGQARQSRVVWGKPSGARLRATVDQAAPERPHLVRSTSPGSADQGTMQQEGEVLGREVLARQAGAPTPEQRDGERIAPAPCLRRRGPIVRRPWHAGAQGQRLDAANRVQGPV